MYTAQLCYSTRVGCQETVFLFLFFFKGGRRSQEVVLKFTKAYQQGDKIPNRGDPWGV